MAAAADIDVAVEKLDPDLRFVLAERDIGKDIQAKFSENGIRSLPVFAMISDTRPDLRSMLNREYSLDPNAANLSVEEATRRSVTAAQIVDAWTNPKGAGGRGAQAQRCTARRAPSRNNHQVLACRHAPRVREVV